MLISWCLLKNNSSLGQLLTSLFSVCMCVLFETATAQWPWAIRTEGQKLERVEGGLELRALWWMDLQSEGEMYKLTSHCWYVSAAHVTGALVVTTCLWCTWVCEDISFYSYESLLQHLDLTQTSVCVFLHPLRVWSLSMCMQLKQANHFHQLICIQPANV